jgi:hypothetical protein
MGFSGVDDLVTKMTVNGKTLPMPWNKITGAAAYAAGRFYNSFTLGGMPVAGTYSGTALNFQPLTDSSQGAWWHGGNVSPDTKHLLNLEMVSAVATAVPSWMLLVDLLGYYPGINMNSATAQTLVNGSSISRYTNGQGVMAFLEMTATSGATAHNIAMSYTNQGGTPGRALGATTACTPSAIVPHLTHSGTAAGNFGPFLPLQSGDFGIRSVQSVTMSAASGAGTAALVLAKPLGKMPLTTVSVAGGRDFLFNMPSLPKIEDGACLAALIFTGGALAANSNIYGMADIAWG